LGLKGAEIRRRQEMAVVWNEEACVGKRGQGAKTDPRWLSNRQIKRGKEPYSWVQRGPGGVAGARAPGGGTPMGGERSKIQIRKGGNGENEEWGHVGWRKLGPRGGEEYQREEKRTYKRTPQAAVQARGQHWDCEGVRGAIMGGGFRPDGWGGFGGRNGNGGGKKKCLSPCRERKKAGNLKKSLSP